MPAIIKQPTFVQNRHFLLTSCGPGNRTHLFLVFCVEIVKLVFNLMRETYMFNIHATFFTLGNDTSRNSNLAVCFNFIRQKLTHPSVAQYEKADCCKIGFQNPQTHLTKRFGVGEAIG